MVLSALALTPGFAVLVLLQIQITASRRAEIRDLAFRNAQQAASELDRIISGLETLLLAVSRAPDAREFREPECAAYLTELQPSLPHLTGLTLIDKDGRFRCGFAAPAPSTNYTDRIYFQNALTSSGLIVGNIRSVVHLTDPFCRSRSPSATRRVRLSALRSPHSTSPG